MSEHGHRHDLSFMSGDEAAVKIFKSRVDASGGESACWPWTGPTRAGGYGAFNYRTHRVVAAHRVALFLATGVQGNVAMHACDNKICVNPAHLSWGDHRQNNIDAIVRLHRRARDSRGERSGNAKLSERDVVAINAALIAGDRQADIAARFGVTQQVISRINTRTTWRHLTGSFGSGGRHSTAKLTEESVLRIRQLLADGARLCDIAAEFGVDRCTISSIRSNQNWRHIQLPVSAGVS